MAVTLSSSKTNLLNASQQPTVGVPTDAAVGDVVYAWMTYGGNDTIATQPTNWTVVATNTFTGTGYFALVKRTMVSGMAGPSWTMTTNAGATYAKSASAIIAVKGGGAETVGTLQIRPSSGAATTLQGVTVASGGVLLAFAGDRQGTTPQSSVTAPTGMTEEAKTFTTTGGGGVSALIASQFPAAGASGTRTVNYGVASDAAAGVLVTIAPASAGTTVPAVTINPRTASSTTGTARTLTATVTGATSQVWTLESSPPLASTTITNPTSATTASYTPTIAGTYVFRLTATNSAGSSNDMLTLTVSGSTVKPVAVISNPGNFVAVGTGAIEDALADSLDSTTVEGAQTSGAALTVQYGPLTATTAVVWHIRADVSAAPNVTCTFNLLQGSAVVATRTQAVTTTTTTFSYTLSTAEVSAITNWADLRLQVVEQ